MKVFAENKPAPVARSRKKRLAQWLIAAYILLLFLSHLERRIHFLSAAPVQREAANLVNVRAVSGDEYLAQSVRIAFEQSGSVTHPVVVLLHGSPGHNQDFRRLIPALAECCRVIAPDLPGFGASTHDIPDYSFRAHARYTLTLLNELKIQRAHFVGFSMGGGVALSLADLAPERVASLTMLSAIGVQEMELLGDYHLNHAIHGAQLVGLWLLRAATPHFGAFDHAMLSVEYARNFYDSDQRPLRAMLQRVAAPMQLIHGKHDELVPVEAAIEHHRLAPQSELHLTESDHFMIFRKDSGLAPLISDFIERAERGTAITRAAAGPARLAQSMRPFDPAHLPKMIGVASLVLLLMIIAATLVSEDLTTISVGVMVAQGRIGFLFGALACFLGIFIGDVMLYLAGRWLGRPALARAPLRWFVSEAAVERSSQWFARNGARVIAASRFLPGARLPTYFAAGVLKTSFWWFTFYFALACAVWTPLLVALSALLGGEVVSRLFSGGEHFLIKSLLAGFVLLVVIRLLARAATWRGRRMLLSQWRRLTRWEFWPMWAFYPPVVGYIAWLALKHRSLTLFTAANPSFPAGGGFVGESKIEILRGLGGAGEAVAKAELIAHSANITERIAQAKGFMTENQLRFPVVLKPNVGERGAGVKIIRSEAEIAEFLHAFSGDTIIQEYAPGPEFGVFYYRCPNAERGRIFAITEKRFPTVTGDGVSTLEELILNDERAVCMARFYCDRHADHLSKIPAAGERVQLVEIGTHSRGSLFLDGGWARTDALEAAIERVSQNFAGFYFGRYDIRVPSLEDFKSGKNLKVIELNGVTSEATSIYDPKNSVFTAWRVLCEQWRIAFEIGAQNRARGAEPASVSELIRIVTESRK
jgi:membrane protein DedA with SNARE-associated domain/pimeloyl-ACP methyl ester carboxylesterase